MSKRKANVNPELVGQVFTQGMDLYRLVECGVEPDATFLNVTTGTSKKAPISDFKDFVLLKPVLPRKSRVPTPRKQRKDKNGTHRKLSAVIMTQTSGTKEKLLPPATLTLKEE